MKFSSLLISTLLIATLTACNGGSDGTQQTAMPNAQQQMAAPAPVDSNMAQQPAQLTAAPQAQALPEVITSFINQYFPGATVAFVEADSEHGGIDYDVTLNDGTEIDFDPNNQWDNVDCHTKAVPAALVPQAIANYVKSNFQSLPITKIDKEMGGYEIELSNGLDLKFDSSGRFLGMDD